MARTMPPEAPAPTIVRRAAGPPLRVPDWTLVDVLQRAAREHPERPAFLAPDGTPQRTWREVAAWAQRIAHGLVALGLRAGDRVAIISETRAEWVIADAAIMMAGCVSVSVFPTLAPGAIRDALRASRARVAFVESAALAEALADETLPIDWWVLLDTAAAAPVALEKRVLSFAALERAGQQEASDVQDAVAARSARVRPDDVAAILFTSGTTGEPKGAALTHRNLVSNSLASIEHLRLRPHPVGLAFLPLAHSYQRQSAVVLMLLAGAVAFSAPARLAHDLPRVRPTLLPAVPRLYERLYARIEETARAQPKRRQRIFAWADAAAREHGRLTMTGARVPLALRARHALFDALVYKRIRRMGGLDRLELAVTGAAAMREDLLCFFRGIGVRIVEGYGLTETAAPSTVNPPNAVRAGTVGTPLPGVEVAIADDGEILLRGPNVFVGYDGSAAQSEAMFAHVNGERWLLTGDVGTLDDAGYLRIVDRKKELEILDTGKNVAPMPVEERLKASPFIAEAVVVAHGRKLVGCLIQPDYERLHAWARDNGVAFDGSCAREGVAASGERGLVATDPALLQDARVLALYGREVAAANEAFGGFEQVKTWRLLATGLSAQAGEITPTMKKRRRVILEQRRDEVDALFRGR